MPENPPNKPPTFCLIGAGFIFDRHLAAIESVGGKLVAVIDIDPKKKDKLDSGVAFFTSYVDFLDSPEAKQVENIVICTPNDTHRHLIMWGLDDGYNVLCEKPGVTNLLDLRLIKEAYERSDRKLFFVHQLRESERLQELRAKLMLDLDRHDVRVSLRMHREESYFNGWKGDNDQSGGLIFNIGVHYIDLLVWLFDLPTSYRILTKDEKKVQIRFSFEYAVCDFFLDLTTPKDQQTRLFTIDGEALNLTRILESLHNKVYDQFLKGKGTTLDDIVPTISLCEQLSSATFSKESSL